VVLNTLTLANPAVAMSLAGTFAVKLVLLIKVVTRGPAFHAIVEPGVCTALFTITGATKFEPFTVSVKAPLPGVALAGERLVIEGPPFCTALIVNVAASDGPPGSGFVTVIAAMPGVATSVARMLTASCVVTVFSLLVRSEPFQKTCDGGLVTKPVPEMNRVNIWLPAVMLEGKRPVITGVGGGVVVEEPQLPSMVVIARSAARTVHRKRINSILLLLFRNLGAARHDRTACEQSGNFEQFHLRITNQN
jgi:hypothetical protein